MKTPNLLNVAMTEFAAQTTYKKLRSYVWHREWENYQGSSPGNADSRKAMRIAYIPFGVTAPLPTRF